MLMSNPICRLTTLPPGLGSLTSLRQLHVANNKLTSLPNEIGFLTRLEVLKADNNRVLTSSVFIALSLLWLQALHFSNNGLKSLPCTLFKHRLQLATLDLHNTEITMDLLREFEGWEDFDERRRSKHQKQVDFRVNSAAFDEGADKN
ncbi:LRR repeats and ubiquitin-like domain-containing protein At2g30105 [Hibiscus syriacus]|uniref:LRR repeats and ubiquitin-like domain-containing protein At2g30105 n=1 Tax=Hibiscus syriacus TaxID=106335 RepID=UPI001923199C|nr:LRR repeats and ubiquitin-like domain-containing protein At2g30105 [Hibiscus syriacus]